MDAQSTVSRISRLLDEARDEVSKGVPTPPKARAVSKIDEAQRLLLGDDATEPEHN